MEPFTETLTFGCYIYVIFYAYSRHILGKLWPSDATFSLIRHSSGSRVNTLGNVDIRLIYQGVLFFFLTPTPDTVWELDENFGETLIFGRHIFSFPSDTVWWVDWTLSVNVDTRPFYRVHRPSCRSGGVMYRSSRTTQYYESAEAMSLTPTTTMCQFPRLLRANPTLRRRGIRHRFMRSPRETRRENTRNNNGDVVCKYTKINIHIYKNFWRTLEYNI